MKPLRVEARDGTETAWELDWPRAGGEPAHGLEGHTGYRCKECAMGSKNPILVESDSGDYWQTKQIRWQEEVDDLHNQFNAQIEAHFPSHQAIGCSSCPKSPAMPAKPMPPVERAVRQSKK